MKASGPRILLRSSGHRGIAACGGGSDEATSTGPLALDQRVVTDEDAPRAPSPDPVEQTADGRRRAGVHREDGRRVRQPEREGQRVSRPSGSCRQSTTPASSATTDSRIDAQTFGAPASARLTRRRQGPPVHSCHTDSHGRGRSRAAIRRASSSSTSHPAPARAAALRLGPIKASGRRPSTADLRPGTPCLAAATRLGHDDADPFVASRGQALERELAAKHHEGEREDAPAAS